MLFVVVANVRKGILYHRGGNIGLILMVLGGRKLIGGVKGFSYFHRSPPDPALFKACWIVFSCSVGSESDSSRNTEISWNSLSLYFPFPTVPTLLYCTFTTRPMPSLSRSLRAWRRE